MFFQHTLAYKARTAFLAVVFSSLTGGTALAAQADPVAPAAGAPTAAVSVPPAESSGEGSVRLASVSPDAPTLGESRAAADHNIFGSVAIPIGPIPARKGWDRILAEDPLDTLTRDCAAGQACGRGFVAALRRIRRNAEGLSALYALRAVNRGVNRVLRYRSDEANYGLTDHWASLADMARRGAGDCEDYAIAKMWLLRSLGLPERQIQFVVLRDTGRDAHHAVLVVHLGTTAYVLDNLSNALKPAGEMSQYRPIYSFAAGRSFLHGFKGEPVTPARIAAVEPS